MNISRLQRPVISSFIHVEKFDKHVSKNMRSVVGTPLVNSQIDGLINECMKLQLQ